MTHEQGERLLSAVKSLRGRIVSAELWDAVSDIEAHPEKEWYPGDVAYSPTGIQVVIHRVDRLTGIAWAANPPLYTPWALSFLHEVNPNPEEKPLVDELAEALRTVCGPWGGIEGHHVAKIALARYERECGVQSGGGG